MFCPNCGAENSTEQKFCRACGMNLAQSASSLLEQFPTSGDSQIERKERMLERFGQVAFGGFGIAVVAGIIGLVYTIITTMVVTGSNFWAGILLSMFVAFAGLALAYVILNEALKEKRSKHLPAAERPLKSPVTAPLLDEGDFEPAVSVTEETTDLLSPVSSRTRRL